MTAAQGERILARAREKLPKDALLFLGLADEYAGNRQM
jgi:hypothetical protein